MGDDTTQDMVHMGNSSAQGHERRQPNHLQIMAALIILTIVEVLVTYTPLPRLPILLPLAGIQVALVVLYHMELRQDSRVFSAIFLMGLLMGLILVVSLILMFGPPLFGRTQ